jgi:NADPH2:quinone reductase
MHDYRWSSIRKCERGIKMVSVVRIYESGTPEVLKVETTEQQVPGAGEVWIEQAAIGVNPLDVSQRKGDVRIPTPNGLGLEGAGTITVLGPEVSGFAVGDRVAYATGPLGAYASGRIFPANRLIKIPDSLSFEDAAAVFFKGITAQYLLKTTYPVAAGSIVVIYGASGGVGQIMVPWAKHLGAFVIGVVSKEASVSRAKNAGCDEVFVFDAERFAQQVAEVTHGKKADVIYDPIGRVSFEASLNSLKPRGLLVSYGMTSGAPPAMEISTLNAKGSLFLTRPSLVAHTADVSEYQDRATDVLDAISKGIIKPNVWGRYSLADVSKAHADLEGGRNQGAVILTP